MIKVKEAGSSTEGFSSKWSGATSVKGLAYSHAGVPEERIAYSNHSSLKHTVTLQ